MSTETHLKNVEPVVWPGDAEQLEPSDHVIVASDLLSDAVELYWNKMGARPSLGDFQLSVAELHRQVQQDEHVGAVGQEADRATPVD